MTTNTTATTTVPVSLVTTTRASKHCHRCNHQHQPTNHTRRRCQGGSMPRKVVMLFSALVVFILSIPIIYSYRFSDLAAVNRFSCGVGGNGKGKGSKLPAVPQTQSCSALSSLRLSAHRNYPLVPLNQRSNRENSRKGVLAGQTALQERLTPIGYQMRQLQLASNVSSYEWHLQGLTNAEIRTLRPNRWSLHPLDLSKLFATSLSWLPTMTFKSITHCVWCIGTLVSADSHGGKDKEFTALPALSSSNTSTNPEPINNDGTTVVADYHHLAAKFASSSIHYLSTNCTTSLAVSEGAGVRTAKSLGKLLTGLAKLPPGSVDTTSATLLAQWLGSPLALRGLSGSDGSGCSIVLWALGRLNVNVRSLSVATLTTLLQRLLDTSKELNDQHLANAVLGLELMGLRWERIPLALRSALCSATCRLCLRMSPHAAGSLFLGLARTGLRFEKLTGRMAVALELAARNAAVRCDPYSPDAARLLQGIAALGFSWNQLGEPTRNNIAEAVYHRAATVWSFGAAKDERVPAEVAQSIQALAALQSRVHYDSESPSSSSTTTTKTNPSPHNDRWQTLPSPIRASVLVGLHSLTDSYQHQLQRMSRQQDADRMVYGAAARVKKRQPNPIRRSDGTTGQGYDDLDHDAPTAVEAVDTGSLAWSLSESLDGLASLGLSLPSLPTSLQRSLLSAIEVLSPSFTAQAACQAPAALAAIGLRWGDQDSDAGTVALGRRLASLAKDTAEWYDSDTRRQMAQANPIDINNNTNSDIRVVLRGLSNALYGLGNMGFVVTENASDELSTALVACLSALLRNQQTGAASSNAITMKLMRDVASLLHAMANVGLQRQMIPADIFDQLIMHFLQCAVRASVVYTLGVGAELEPESTSFAKSVALGLRGLSLMGIRYDDMSSMSITRPPDGHYNPNTSMKTSTAAMSMRASDALSTAIQVASSTATVQGVAMILQALARMAAPLSLLHGPPLPRRSSRSLSSSPPHRMDELINSKPAMSLLAAIVRTADAMPSQELALAASSLAKLGVRRRALNTNDDANISSKSNGEDNGNDDDVFDSTLMKAETAIKMEPATEMETEMDRAMSALVNRLSVIEDLDMSAHVVKLSIALAVCGMRWDGRNQLPVAAKLALLRSAVRYCRYEELSAVQRALQRMKYSRVSISENIGNSEELEELSRLKQTLSAMFLHNKAAA